MTRTQFRTAVLFLRLLKIAILISATLCLVPVAGEGEHPYNARSVIQQELQIVFKEKQGRREKIVFLKSKYKTGKHLVSPDLQDLSITANKFNGIANNGKLS